MQAGPALTLSRVLQTLSLAKPGVKGNKPVLTNQLLLLTLVLAPAHPTLPWHPLSQQEAKEVSPRKGLSTQITWRQTEINRIKKKTQLCLSLFKARGLGPVQACAHRDSQAQQPLWP